MSTKKSNKKAKSTKTDNGTGVNNPLKLNAIKGAIKITRPNK